MKESVRILRFAIVGSSNALITALVIWILMDILDCKLLVVEHGWICGCLGE